MFMIKRYWYFPVLFLLALVYIVGAYVSKNDKQISISICSFLSLITVFVASIIGDERRKKIKVPNKVKKRLAALFACSMAAILAGHLAGYLLIGCIISFVLGCVALIDINSAVSRDEET